METDEVKELILDIHITCLQAQLRALRRLRSNEKKDQVTSKRLSQIDMVYNILRREGSGLHINGIIERVHLAYGVRLDRESIVSALSKKIRRKDRFVRTGKNTFAVLKTKP
jgi:uncharacterized protein YeeX (DUF496 family)